MEIGVIGMNEYAKAFCKHWIRQGHTILFADIHLYAGSYVLAEDLGPQVTLAVPEIVARQAEIIVLAVPPYNRQAAIDGLGDVQQKIIIDLIVEEPVVRDTHLPVYKSAPEDLQNHLPKAKVVKVTAAFPLHLYQPDQQASDIIYSYSDHHLAQRLVRWLMDGSGYKIIDLQNSNP